MDNFMIGFMVGVLFSCFVIVLGFMIITHYRDRRNRTGTNEYGLWLGQDSNTKSFEWVYPVDGTNPAPIFTDCGFTLPKLEDEDKA